MLRSNISFGRKYTQKKAFTGGPVSLKHKEIRAVRVRTPSTKLWSGVSGSSVWVLCHVQGHDSSFLLFNSQLCKVVPAATVIQGVLALSSSQGGRLLSQEPACLTWRTACAAGKASKRSPEEAAAACFQQADPNNAGGLVSKKRCLVLPSHTSSPRSPSLLLTFYNLCLFSPPLVNVFSDICGVLFV